MERNLIANYLVPDDEVWVSPATWGRPFSLRAKESTDTTPNSAMVPCPYYDGGRVCRVGGWLRKCGQSACEIAQHQ